MQYEIIFISTTNNKRDFASSFNGLFGTALPVNWFLDQIFEKHVVWHDKIEVALWLGSGYDAEHGIYKWNLKF